MALEGQSPDADYILRCMEEMGMDVSEGEEPFAPNSVLSNREWTYDEARQGYIVTAELRDGMPHDNDH